MILNGVIFMHRRILSVYVLPFLNLLTDHQWSCTMAMWPEPQPALVVCKFSPCTIMYVNLFKLTQKKQAMKLPANMTGILVLIRNPSPLLLS